MNNLWFIMNIQSMKYSRLQLEKAEKEAQVELQASEITTSEEHFQKQLQQIEVYGILY